LEFLARLIQHVPPKGHKLWREYGAYSTVTRARCRKLAEAEAANSKCADDPAPPPSPAETPGRKQCTSAWATFLSRVWGFDPLEYPHCGSQMEIAAFIHDPDSLHRITTHHRLDSEVPELKPARGPPPWSQGELDYGQEPDDEALFVDPPFDDGLPVFQVD